MTLELDFQVGASFYGENEGYITFKPKGGKKPYLYSIDCGDTFQQNPTFEHLEGGIYTCIVKDAKGTAASIDITVQKKISEHQKLFLENLRDCNGHKALAAEKTIIGKTTDNKNIPLRTSTVAQWLKDSDFKGLVDEVLNGEFGVMDMLKDDVLYMLHKSVRGGAPIYRYVKLKGEDSEIKDENGKIIGYKTVPVQVGETQSSERIIMYLSDKLVFKTEKEVQDANDSTQEVKIQATDYDFDLTEFQEKESYEIAENNEDE